VTESALAPANRAVSHVCDKCEAIDQKIEHYERIERGVSDQLTLDRIKTAVAELTAEKVAMHPQE
jgi:hypothetical protein